MQPTPSKFKKFLVPGVIIIGLVLVGVLLFMKGGTIDQGAALFNATTKTASIKTGVAGSLATNTQPLPCLVGSTVPQIKVMSPNGGEVFTAGQQITVKWSTCNIPPTELIRINLKDIVGNTGAGWIDTQNDGSETLTVHSPVFINGTTPIFPSMIFGNRYKVAISITNPTPAMQPMDVSDNLFTINGGLARVCKPTDPLSIRVESPNGGETFMVGQKILVRWGTCGGRSDDTARITLTTTFGQGASVVLTTAPEQPGYALVMLPSSIGTMPVVAGNYYKIKVDYLDNVPGGSLFATDTSNNFFRIQ